MLHTVIVTAKGESVREESFETVCPLVATEMRMTAQQQADLELYGEADSPFGRIQLFECRCNRPAQHNLFSMA